MLYLVCYDIADDRRRARMVAALLDYGSRIQESVFVAHLDDELYGRMRKRMESLIAPDEDRVHVARVCAACEKEIVAFGLAEIRKDADYWVL